MLQRVEPTWGDAWFLLAVDWTRRDDMGWIVGEVPGDLSAVIGAADAMNHSMLVKEEIEHAVRLLVPAGLLHVAEDRFEVTQEGRRLCDRATNATSDGAHIVDTIRQIQRSLHELPEPQGEPFYWSLDPALLESADRRYRARFREERDRLEAMRKPPADPPRLILP
jgi:hypothetical protein